MKTREEIITAVSAEGRSETRKPTRKKTKWTKESIVGLIILLIPLVGYLIFSGFPVVISFIIQFADMDRFDLDSLKWNNFANFSAVFTDGRFWHSIGITLWLLATQFVSLFIALVMAALLSRDVKGSKIFQIIYFVPYICSTIAISVMWMWIFDGSLQADGITRGGVLNSILGTNINWLDNPDNPATLTWAIFVSIVWRAPGYGIVMYIAAFKAVNPALHEAAQLDGANGFQRFVHVTLPGIAPTTLYLAMAGVTAGMGIFGEATIMAPINWDQVAGRNDMGLTSMYYIYLEGVKSARMPTAAVMSWFMFIITFIPSFLLLRWRNKKEEAL